LIDDASLVPQDPSAWHANAVGKAYWEYYTHPDKDMKPKLPPDHPYWVSPSNNRIFLLVLAIK